MARPILSEYGPDANKPQADRATCGGYDMDDRVDVNDYQPPWGPKGIMDRARPGLHGNVYPCGSQGPYGLQPGENSGSPGLHGKNRGTGTNRG